MSIWFEGSNSVACSLQRVKDSLQDLGAHYVGVIGQMPGLSRVELVEHGSDFVTIETNEGVMKRTNISIRVEADSVVVELDEEYQAGSLVTANSHFCDQFETTETGVEHRVVISGVEAPGVLGFFYRKLGSNSIGKAFLTSHKTFLESQAD